MERIAKGFSLIELMIVVTIIGIIASFAIPAYQDYLLRSQTAEGVVLLFGGKTPLAEFYGNVGRWPDAAESVMGVTSGKYVESVAITGGNNSTDALTLTATMKSSGVSTSIAGKTIQLSSVNGGGWTCAAGTLDPKYLPSSCK